jgi:hypothetical protein
VGFSDVRKLDSLLKWLLDSPLKLRLFEAS